MSVPRGVCTFALALMAIVLFVPFVATAADEPVGQGWQLGFTVYELLAPILTAFLSALSVKVAQFISARIEHEALAGVLVRFSDSLFAAVKQTNQTLKDEILKAKDPKSPGGIGITAEEAARLKDAVWHQLKIEYGGLAGLRQVLKVLGLDDDGMKHWVDGRIEAAVHDVKMLERVSANPG